MCLWKMERRVIRGEVVGMAACEMDFPHTRTRQQWVELSP